MEERSASVSAAQSRPVASAKDATEQLYSLLSEVYNRDPEFSRRPDGWVDEFIEVMRAQRFGAATQPES